MSKQESLREMAERILANSYTPLGTPFVTIAIRRDELEALCKAAFALDDIDCITARHIDREKL